MTLESWMLDNLIQLVILVGGGIIGFVKLSNFAREFTKHIDPGNENPHAICPAHTVGLKNIEMTLVEIKEALSKLDNRIFVLLSKMGDT